VSAKALARRHRVFIDGEAGTTGLGIRQRLEAMPGIDLLRIDPALRKEAGARADLMAAADLVILCLPDDAAREAVALAQALGADQPRILDASSAHRVAEGWTFGFPELTVGQDMRIAAAARVSNPGCYATGAIALLRPLVDVGLIPPSHPLSINAVSGYSGGGKSMVESHEATGGPAFELYGLTLEHKHVPEIMRHSGLTHRPIFVPSVGHFRQGMIVSVPLHLETLPGKPRSADLLSALKAHYRQAAEIRVLDGSPTRLEPETLNDTNAMELAVITHDGHGHAVLVARLDNLGKGASGAAVQNMRLMLDLPA
jgi:N-acetyl-gamma-glutamyl-phosphate reductase